MCGVKPTRCVCAEWLAVRVEKPFGKDGPARDGKKMILKMSFSGLPVRLHVGDPAAQEE
jgi:hypothetical protein